MDRRVLAAVLGSGYGSGGSSGERVSNGRKRKSCVSDGTQKGVRVEGRKDTYSDDDTGIICG